MNILFVHQNFPGQYKHLAEYLAQLGTHRIVALCQRSDVPALPGITVQSYRPHHQAPQDGYALSRYWETCAGAGYGVIQACQQLQEAGFRPDIVLGHVGWGELTFLKVLWPDVPILGYFEYFYLAQGGSVGFDPEFPANADTPYVMHARNAVNFANIHTVDLGQCPTAWQRATFPDSFQPKLYQCHDGVRTDLIGPDPDVAITLGRVGRPLTRADAIVTFVARNLEPTRGFHHFMRAVPAIQAAQPRARIIILGGSEVSYGRKSDAQGGYRGAMEQELGDRVDWDRLHFLGRVPYADYLRLLQISSCHVYLTAPFVLSWSLIEAMAAGAAIVGSDTAPVREVLTEGATARLVDFFDPAAIAQKVHEVLAAPEEYAALGQAARAQAQAEYDFRTVCLPVHLQRINSLLPRAKHLPMPT